MRQEGTGIGNGYMHGKRNIDDRVTHTMPVEDINTRFGLMKRRESIRGVLLF